jgi:hypothetical protein
MTRVAREKGHLKLVRPKDVVQIHVLTAEERAQRKAAREAAPWWEGHTRDPNAARLAQGRTPAELAAVLAEDMQNAAAILASPHERPTSAETIPLEARVLAAWDAWHFDGKLRDMKQRQLIDALEYVRERGADYSLAERRSLLRGRLGKIDAEKGRDAWPGDEHEPASEPGIPDAVIDAALASWPPKRGRPKGRTKDSKEVESDWDRLNRLFAAFGCGCGEGQALRVHLARTGIYRAKKA